MEAVRSEDFLEWTSSVGIGFDPRYPETRCLCLLPPRDHARFWVLPTDPAAWPHLAGTLLDALDDWVSGLLWPRSGSWPTPAPSQDYHLAVRDVLLHGAGIPAGWAGAVRFSREEKDVLLAALFAYLVFGWCVDDDLYFVPDHGRQLLQTAHHDVIHVECSSEDRLQRLVTDVAHAGYQLPSEPPDCTFKRPAWMGDSEPGAIPGCSGIEKGPG
jgi:hypothetical protein